MNHKQIVHGKDLKYDCKECNKFFSNMEDMRTHLQREHSYKKTNEGCFHCFNNGGLTCKDPKTTDTFDFR